MNNYRKTMSDFQPDIDTSIKVESKKYFLKKEYLGKRRVVGEGEGNCGGFKFMLPWEWSQERSANQLSYKTIKGR